jgi:DNA-binding MarR family transcriptional regulator
MSTHAINVPVDYALVLQQIYDAGEEDLANLAETLRLSRARLLHILEALKHKGLISTISNSYGAVWFRVSRKGKKYITSLWPTAASSAHA